MSDTLSHEALELLRDVFQHPEDGVRKRYARLGLSMQKGGELKEELLVAGWVLAKLVPVGRTRRLVLAPTRHARRMLGSVESSSWASIEHQFWQHYWAARLRRRGYQVTVEGRRAGGRVDVLAQSARHRVAVEIETGKSDAVRNVRNCLQSRFDTVLVVATTESAKRRVAAQLDRAGLLTDPRLRIGVCASAMLPASSQRGAEGGELAHSS